jgi:hypothetical protein
MRTCTTCRRPGTSRRYYTAIIFQTMICILTDTICAVVILYMLQRIYNYELSHSQGPTVNFKNTSFMNYHRAHTRSTSQFSTEKNQLQTTEYKHHSCVCSGSRSHIHNVTSLRTCKEPFTTR